MSKLRNIPDLQSNGLSLRGRRGGQAPPAVYADVVARPAQEESAVGLLGYWDTINRNRGKILLLAIVGGCIGYLSLLPQTPVYRASTSLEVLEVNSSFLNLKNLDPTVENYSLETRIHTEMKMLQSQTLVRQVQEKVLQSNAPLLVNEPDLLSNFLTRFGLPPLRRQRSRLDAVRMAASTLQIRNQDMTRILELTSESTDPRTAAEFANNLTQTYMDTTVEGRLDNAQRTRDWLDRQIEEIRQRLESSNNQLVNYAQSAGLALGTESADKLRKLQEKLTEAQAETIRRGVEYRAAKSGEAGLLSDFQDPDLRLLKQSQIQNDTQLAELRTALAPGHYRIRRLEIQQEDLKSRIKAAEERIVRRLETEYEKAQLMENIQTNAYMEQSKLVSEQDRKMVRHNMLQREVETYRQLYDAMLQRVKEASIASALRASNVRVVDKAEVPKRPYKPQPARNVMTGVATGLFLGVVLVIVRSTSDKRFRLPGEASAYLNVKELGSIPSAAVHPAFTRQVRFGLKRNGMLTKLEENSSLLGDMVELATWKRTPSPEAESFRSVLVSLLSRTGDQASIVVTSPNPADGKTSVACNLAIALTEVGRRVLLVDGDLRASRLHEVFNLAPTPGLVDMVESDVPLERCVSDVLSRTTEIPQLYVLPSGQATGNVARLLHSLRMRDLLTRLQNEFDVTLIDTPPMMPFPDARILARLASGAVMVFRAGVTDREVGRSAVERLEEDGIEIFGAILNDWDAKKTAIPYGRYKPRARAANS